jgi:hypothetical protein
MATYRSTGQNDLDAGTGSLMVNRLQDIDNQIIDYETRVAEKEKNCLDLLDDSISLGVNTNAELYTQGAQLDRISKTLRKTEIDAQASAQTLTNMEWRDKHPFLSLFIRARQKTKSWFVPSSTTSHDEIPGADQAQSVRGQRQPIQTGDKFADTIGNKISILKSLALDMNEELDTQNKKLEEINDHTEHVTNLVDSARNRASKMIR